MEWTHSHNKETVIVAAFHFISVFGYRTVPLSVFLSLLRVKITLPKPIASKSTHFKQMLNDRLEIS